ncbi:MAG TPA: C-terminal binding protein, partial [Caulobacteraceae bacterium]|nr:C-terminal binding protein [Caulobacteraceae bacterium]
PLTMPNVLITDYPWPDLAIEQRVLGEAGLSLVAGPPRASPAEVIDALNLQHDPVAMMSCWARLSARAIANAPSLRHIARLGVGLDNIDVAAATAHGVQVTNLPDYCVEEVSDHAVALLAAWARGLVFLDRQVKQGRWEPGVSGLRRISDLVVGVLGYGRVGRRAAEKLSGFGTCVLASGRGPIADPGPNVEPVSFDELLARSDAVLICAPLTEATHHLFNDDAFARMRPGACVVNVTRGAIIDNDALVRALKAGRLSGAGLDVVEGEPNPPAALTERGDVIVTPHVAFSSASSVTELRTRVSQEIVRVYRGEPPEHPCNRPV